MGVVTSRLYNRDLGSVMNDIKHKLSKINLPPSYQIIYGGSYAEQQNSFDELLKILIAGALLVFTVVLFMFKSIKLSITVLFISVLGVSGSLLGLYLTHTPLNVGSYTGMIMIIGIIGENSIFTIQQFLTRENFRLRWENNDAIYLHETFYAIMQGYDAYAMRTDVQIGGTDQLFNIITAARKLMTFLGIQPNIGIIMGILPGTDGEIKMSKSLGNHIPIMASPEDMYGKVMSVPDKAMGDYFRMVTRWTPAEIEK
ncbi:MAG: efflux RND transporter permease subunit, partial [Anaerolineales bacterium]